jgi:succinyl-diaminopimelate desuccinylase
VAVKIFFISRTMSDFSDPLPLAQSLLRCASVTPEDDGAQAILAEALQAIGFSTTHLPFGNIKNLYAERPGPGIRLCFAGHTDVVPPGKNWRHDPFAGIVENGTLYGRGACDMKTAIAAFCAAAATTPGNVSLLITGDEEGEALDGTARVLEWMQANGKIPDFCLVGEPTCQAKLGDTIKIGRRGSLSATISVTGRQGHTAYPHRADNPIHRLVPALTEIAARELDSGTEWFEPSTLQITTIDVGNPASNVIPASVTAKLNIRFNPLHTEASLTDWLTETLAPHAPLADLKIHCSGEAFLTRPAPETEKLAAAITRITGIKPAQTTGGGTSDARFIARYCPVAEFGLVGATMHQTDEQVPVEELRDLTAIYQAIIKSFAR